MMYVPHTYVRIRTLPQTRRMSLRVSLDTSSSSVSSRVYVGRAASARFVYDADFDDEEEEEDRGGNDDDDEEEGWRWVMLRMRNVRTNEPQPALRMAREVPDRFSVCMYAQR